MCNRAKWAWRGCLLLVTERSQAWIPGVLCRAASPLCLILSFDVDYRERQPRGRATQSCLLAGQGTDMYCQMCLSTGQPNFCGYMKLRDLFTPSLWRFLAVFEFLSFLHTSQGLGGWGGGVGVTRDPVKLSQRLIPGQDKGCATVLSWHFLKPPLVAVQTKNTLNIFLFYLFILNPSTISWDCY